MSDLVRAIPLQRPSLVEASAGTGKTYALAGVFARAVIVDRLRVPQVLAVTYTIAATAELHARVRSRLRRAAELAAQWRDGDPVRRDNDRAEVALLRALLHEALHGEVRESLPALRLRLARAVREMDLAAITTIHGFCQRLLREHALDAGQAMAPVTLQPDNRASRHALAVALWREFSADAQGSAFLRRRFGDVVGLAAQVVPLLAPEPLLPAPPLEVPADADVPLSAAWEAMRTAFVGHGAAALAAVQAAIDDGVLKASEYKRPDAMSLWAWLRDATSTAQPPREWHGKLHKYAMATLRKGTYKARAADTPQSPLFDAVAALLDAGAAATTLREAQELQWLHRLRARARERDRAHKQAFQVRGFDDLVGDVSEALEDAATRDRLAAALRAQFPLVLVDEFQDTDARQWANFRRLFGEAGLVLVGDPKQAIYGFRGGDVHTYLQARATVDDTRTLDRNHRSRPCVVEAVNTLFAGMPGDAMGQGIVFERAVPARAGHDTDFLVDGAPAQPLAFHVVPQAGGRDLDAADSLEAAAVLCARAVRDHLQAARDGRATRAGADGRQRPLEPRDCAVLVRRNREAAAVRRALAGLGVPAVATGAQSLFDSEAAQDLLALLLALAAPGDPRRLRAMLATRLFAHDAVELVALADDGERMRAWQSDCERWRLRWEKHGAQAMLAEVLAERAAAVLQHADGERRLTHLLQLGELLQEARASHPGIHGQLDWLRAAIDGADDKDETQWPRLESDSGRVQILTLHKSKGLEFPLVFLPFVGIGGGGRSSDFVTYHDVDDVRVRQWKCGHVDPGTGTFEWKAAKARAAQEGDEEDMRLLYVGLTRAIDALWVCGGALYAKDKSALYRLLGNSAPDADLCAELDLAPTHGLPRPGDGECLPPSAPAGVPAAREPVRTLRRDWWIHSFSQLHRQKPHGAHAVVEEAPATDERPLATTPPAAFEGIDPRFRGERFGNAVHHALEHADFAAWRDHAGDAPPPAQREVLVAALQSQDYLFDGGSADSHDDGVRALAPLVAATLNAPLPEGGRLCELPPHARIPEIEFHFTLADADAGALLALLHAHGIARDRRDFGAWPRLAGLMTGKIDLTYVNDGRVYVLDYKSNLLPGYDQATLAEAMRASEYDLQALLYVVALHRWLRARRGDGYDYDRDFGGVRYLFCRGLDRAEPARGVIAPRFERTLVEAVDAVFGNGEAHP